jgi:pseudaminic acid cytidylyltransferase
MSSICIIPARGGSKRIPGKNVKDFCGKPIIAYSIEAALKSKLFDEVMVSTDDSEIARIARGYGAKVPFLRSNKNSDDNTGLAEVVIEVVNTFSEGNIFYNYVCCLLPTAPFVNSKMIRDVFDLLDESVDAAMPIVKYSYPIQRSLKKNINGNLEMNWPENYSKQSQSFEDIYHDSGLFFWIKPDVLKIEKKVFVEKIKGYLLSELYVHDIDTEEDWAIAELKYQLLLKRNTDV